MTDSTPSWDAMSADVCETIQNAFDEMLDRRWPYSELVLGVIYNAVQNSMPAKSDILDAIADGIERSMPTAVEIAAALTAQSKRRTTSSALHAGA